ncbi:hypothetical protein PBCVKS1B_406R [Paramecium bursaria Chlorella virus KS1B]|nr:hypothetical protein PBCVKS1B_406R [Paramecium bursaria Chlorella virus KS1B]
MFSTLEYYYKDGRHMVFEKYTIDTSGVVRNKNNSILKSHTIASGYKILNIHKDGISYGIRVNRAVASSFLGPPPDLDYTADHIDRNKDNNTLNNIRWLDNSGQTSNREIPDTNKNAFIVVKDGIEKTVKDWVEQLNNEKTPFGNAYTRNIIKNYAQRKQYGFAYKVFNDIPGEIWKPIPKSNVEISNKLRVKRTTKFASNVLEVNQLYISTGYPMIIINGKKHYVHHICFQAFYPDKYNAMKPDEIIRHKNDDKLDFRPENLIIGSRSQNIIDAHDNGKYDDKKTMRIKVSIDGVEYKSLSEASKILGISRQTITYRTE